ncbi:PH domain-containing protein [Actinoplanes sp. GCM10030250]|uniref:PH domain-containing protein n=1 Tax=Actinoplanes sp. GCM10030250 TaxID=3273376 RepID=UPI003618CC22
MSSAGIPPGQPYPGAPEQPHPAQPYPGQPYPGPADQPYPGQPYPGQPAAGQPAAGQPAAGQPSAGQPAAGQPAAGQPSAGPAEQPYPGVPGQAYPGAEGPARGGLEERQKLHPLSPLLNGAKSIVVIIAALSWQTFGQLGAAHFAMVVGVLAIAVVIFSVVGWWNTGYQVVGRELRIAEGLIWRRNRAIPLDRLQAVELRRPLLAQLTGLAELRLEVVGGGKTEAPLAYLTVQNATILRERLLALSGRTPGPVPGTTTDGPAANPAAAPLFRVRNQDLLVSQLLTPQAFFLPIGIAWVVTQFVMEGSWTFIGIASTVTAMAGVLLQPIRRVLRDWNFQLAHDHDSRLVLHYGLVETRSQVVPLHRVQTVRVTWPLLWRKSHWLNLRLDIAGYSAPEAGDDKSSDRLMPVGDIATARFLIAAALPGVDLATLATSPPPLRARWLHPLALRFYGAGLAPDVFVTRWGRVTREMSLVPYARIQSVRVVQGPLQRRLRLATVYADTAGGRSGMARDRDLAEAWALAEQLAIRARQARDPESPSSSAPFAPPASGAPFAPPTSGAPFIPPAPGASSPPGPITPDDETFWQRPSQP